MNKQEQPIRVLFVCTENSARSQMAEALLRHLDSASFAPYSAGVEASRVHPLTIAALTEIGVDASGLHAKHIQTFAGQEFAIVVTLSGAARDAVLPLAGRPERLFWPVADPGIRAPGETPLDAFRSVRDRLRDRLIAFSDERRA